LTPFVFDSLARSDRIVVVNGDKSQYERDRALLDFRDSRARIMVCTDVYARGLDVKDITCVVNFEMPMDFQSYVQRIAQKLSWF
jgi:superfamily II DNA/RNA helicase